LFVCTRFVGFGPSDPDKLCNEADELLNLLPMVECGYECGYTPGSYVSAVKSKIRDLEKFANDPFSFRRREVLRMISNLRGVANKIALTIQPNVVRRQPFGIAICGEPGTGKTFTAMELSRALCSLLKPVTRDEIIVLNESDDFQSEFRTRHRIVVFDDLGASRAAVTGRDDYRKVIDFINNVPKTSLNPHLELKGNVWIQPDIVVVTTNERLPFRFLHAVSCTKAVNRRFQLMIEQLGFDRYRIIVSREYICDRVEKYDCDGYERLLKIARPLFLEYMSQQEDFVHIVENGWDDYEREYFSSELEVSEALTPTGKIWLRLRDVIERMKTKWFSTIGAYHFVSLFIPHVKPESDSNLLKKLVHPSEARRQPANYCSQCWSWLSSRLSSLPYHIESPERMIHGLMPDTTVAQGKETPPVSLLDLDLNLEEPPEVDMSYSKEDCLKMLEDKSFIGDVYYFFDEVFERYLYKTTVISVMMTKLTLGAISFFLNYLPDDVKAESSSTEATDNESDATEEQCMVRRTVEALVIQYRLKLQAIRLKAARCLFIATVAIDSLCGIICFFSGRNYVSFISALPDECKPESSDGTALETLGKNRHSRQSKPVVSFDVDDIEQVCQPCKLFAPKTPILSPRQPSAATWSELINSDLELCEASSGLDPQTGMTQKVSLSPRPKEEQGSAKLKHSQEGSLNHCIPHAGNLSARALRLSSQYSRSHTLGGCKFDPTSGFEMPFCDVTTAITLVPAPSFTQYTDVFSNRKKLAIATNMEFTDNGMGPGDKSFLYSRVLGVLFYHTMEKPSLRERQILQTYSDCYHIRIVIIIERENDIHVLFTEPPGKGIKSVLCAVLTCLKLNKSKILHYYSSNCITKVGPYPLRLIGINSDLILSWCKSYLERPDT